MNYYIFIKSYITRENRALGSGTDAVCGRAVARPVNGDFQPHSSAICLCCVIGRAPRRAACGVGARRVGGSNLPLSGWIKGRLQLDPSLCKPDLASCPFSGGRKNWLGYVTEDATQPVYLHNKSFPRQILSSSRAFFRFHLVGQQVFERRQRGLGAFAHGNHNLLVGHRGHVTTGVNAGR